MRLDHQFVKVNDGLPSPYSALDLATTEALVAWHERGGLSWSSITIRHLPCDNRSPQARDTHYPNVCWHYAVTITGPDPEPKMSAATDDPPTKQFVSFDWKDKPGYVSGESK